MKKIVEETVNNLVTHVQLLSKIPQSDAPLNTLVGTSHRMEFTLDKVFDLLKRVALKFEKIDKRLNAQQTGQSTEHVDFDSNATGKKEEAATVPRP